MYQALEVHAGIGEMARALGWSQDTVRKELTRLMNFGWVQGVRTPRLLGHREGHTLYLLADLAVEQVTGEQHAVSAQVLQLPVPSVESRREKRAVDGRGTNRRWDGSATEVWGDSR